MAGSFRDPGHPLARVQRQTRGRVCRICSLTFRGVDLVSHSGCNAASGHLHDRRPAGHGYACGWRADRASIGSSRPRPFSCASSRNHVLACAKCIVRTCSRCRSVKSCSGFPRFLSLVSANDPRPCSSCRRLTALLLEFSCFPYKFLITVRLGS